MYSLCMPLLTHGDREESDCQDCQGVILKQLQVHPVPDMAKSSFNNFVHTTPPGKGPQASLSSIPKKTIRQ